MKRKIRVWLTLCGFAAVLFLGAQSRVYAAADVSTTVEDDDDEADMATAIDADASETEVVITVSADDIAASSTYSAIQGALNVAKKSATAEKPYIIQVEPGVYTLKNAVLKLYSNTTLDLTEVTIIRSGAYNILRVGDVSTGATDGQSGYYYQNIGIVGGTLDGNQKKSTICKFGHVSNLSMSGVVMENASEAHIMEIGGVENISIDGCVFRNQTLSATNSVKTYEALQIDINNQSHLPGYRSEVLQNRNISVTNCEFRSVPRGVGSHSSILNLPTDGVVISGNTFTNIASCAIQSQNWINATIENNTITNAPRGIAVYAIIDSGNGCYKASAIASESGIASTVSASYQAPGNQNIIVRGNQITVGTATDPYPGHYKAGIILYGNTVSSSVSYTDGSGKLPKGNYYVGGAKVTGNTISTYGNGIMLIDARDTVVRENTVSCHKKKGNTNTYHGIQISEKSKNISVARNSIANARTTGIYVTNASTLTKLSNNKISKSAKYGILVDGSKVTRLSGNKISDTSSAGILLYRAAKVSNLLENTVKNAKTNGLFLDEKARVGAAADNLITGAKDAGVRLEKKSKITKLFSNRIYQNHSAIEIEKGSKITTLINNYLLAQPKLTKAVRTEKGVRIRWKAVSGAVKYRVYRRTASGNWKRIKTTADLTYLDQTAKTGKTYYYTIRAYNSKVLLSTYDVEGTKVSKK